MKEFPDVCVAGLDTEEGEGEKNDLFQSWLVISLCVFFLSFSHLELKKASEAQGDPMLQAVQDIHKALQQLSG